MARPWGILVIVALALAGCTAQPAEQSTGAGTNPPTSPPAVAAGSLALGGGVSDTCADGSASHSFTFGVPLTNRSDAAVHLVSAEFEHIGGVELIGTWLMGREVDDDDPDAATSWTVDYPPTGTSGQGWEDRTAIGDSTVSAHSSTWVAFALELPEGVAAGAATRLTLHFVDAEGAESVTDPSTYGIGAKDDDGELSCAL